VRRQYTDGEIFDVMQRITSEGGRLTCSAVQKRLGGGGVERIRTLLKDFENRNQAEAVPAATKPLSPEAAEALTSQASPTEAKPSPLAKSASETLGGEETEVNVARLQSEVRVLKIMIESERQARKDAEARHAAVVVALQRELELEIAARTGLSAKAKTVDRNS